MNNLSVFEIKTGGEIDWICGATEEEALEYYLATTGISAEEIDLVTNLPESKWPHIGITYDCPKMEATAPGNIAEYMKTAVSREIICSTAY